MPLTECEEESLVVEEARAGGHHERWRHLQFALSSPTGSGRMGKRGESDLARLFLATSSEEKDLECEMARCLRPLQLRCRMTNGSSHY